MKLRKNRKTAIVVSTLLALIILISATFAWITAKDTRINHFENQGYITDGSVIVVEDFDKPTEWRPGMEVDKKVHIANTGAGDVLVRVAFEEMLQVLENGGAARFENKPAGADGCHEDYASNKLIAAKVNALNYIYGDAGDPWVKLSIAVDASLPSYTVPTDVTILKTATGDGLIAFYEYSPGLFQSVRVGEHEVNLAGNTITLKEELKYSYFTEGVAEYFSWNKKSNVGAPWPTNYSSQSGLATTTATSNLTNTITLTYDGLAIAANIANANKWYYSADDGYFYYLGTVKSGQTTTMLLSAVKMLGAADKTFTKVDYDLAVTVEAIQAAKEALGAPGAVGVGWEIDDSTLLALLQNEFCTE